MKPILVILLFVLVCVNHRIQFAHASRPFASLAKLESLSVFKRDASQQISEDSDSSDYSSSDSSDESSISETNENTEKSRISSPPTTSATPHQSASTQSPSDNNCDPRSNSPQKETGLVDTLRGGMVKMEDTGKGMLTAAMNVIKCLVEARVKAMVRPVLPIITRMQTILKAMMKPLRIISRALRSVDNQNTAELSNSIQRAPKIIRDIAKRSTRELSNSMKITPRTIRSIAEDNIGESLSSMIMDPTNIRTIAEYITQVSSNSMKMAPRSIRAAVENSYLGTVSGYNIIDKIEMLLEYIAKAPPEERERYIQITREIWCLVKELFNYGTCSAKDMPDITAINQLSWWDLVYNGLTWLDDHRKILTKYGLLSSEGAASIDNTIQTIKSVLKFMSLLNGNQ